jgi:hypothetical protein
VDSDMTLLQQHDNLAVDSGVPPATA